MRSDFKKHHKTLEKLLLFAKECHNLFCKFGDLNSKGYEKVFDLASKPRKIAEDLYAEGKGSSCDMSFKLEAFYDIARFPSLYEYVAFLERETIFNLRIIKKVINNSKEYNASFIPELRLLCSNLQKLLEESLYEINKLKETKEYKERESFSEKDEIFIVNLKNGYTELKKKRRNIKAGLAKTIFSSPKKNVKISDIVRKLEEEGNYKKIKDIKEAKEILRKYISSLKTSYKKTLPYDKYLYNLIKIEGDNFIIADNVKIIK
jgi:hypothetical protein